MLKINVKSIAAKVGKPQAIPYEYSGDANNITFQSSNPAICEVDAAGKIMPIKTGIVVITITVPDFDPAVVTVTVTN